MIMKIHNPIHGFVPHSAIHESGFASEYIMVYSWSKQLKDDEASSVYKYK